MILMRLKFLRETRKKQLSIIPFIMTFANACLGLMSVLYAFNGQFAAAAYCIIGAALLDAGDGKVARVLGSASPIGMELDSLCDAVSFCFVPAIILYSWKLYAIHWVGILAVGVYLCAGLFRLAKFNLTSSGQRMFFKGLPTTIAAVWIAGLVTASCQLVTTQFHTMLEPYPLAVLVCFVAFLMISPLRFPTFKSKHYSLVVKVIGIVSFGVALYYVLHGAPFLLTMISFYIVTSMIYGLGLFVKKQLAFE